RRSTRALAGMVVALVALAGGQMAWAHQSPSQGTGNLLNVGVTKDKTAIANRETVTFTLTTDNNTGGACDITGANITFFCPAPDGSPTGAQTVCATNKDFLAGFSPPSILCTVPCTVTFNSNVTSAQILVQGQGTLHDNPLNDN